ncbi:MAG: 16S rRNA (cytidine(1402)-2'-O)-methyltransferase [Bacteroidales bacterium]|nr:16S rRNA (cytidine(1402)-2'-O)-methyltransferase [Bacteroidales bacterium]
MAKLIIVPTPIGNLEDITLRAINVLKECDLILCEDTRTSSKLLRHLQIDKPCIAYHMNNEHKSLSRFIDVIKSKENVCLISDAGTPAISDPGFLIVRECIKNEIEVECLPGPTAFVPALVASGIPCDRFFFYGFLPHKKGRQTALIGLAEMENTVVLYESPHRLIKALEQIKEFFGENRQVCVAREISKIYESYIRGTADEVLNHYKEKESIKGEIVIIVAGKE